MTKTDRLLVSRQDPETRLYSRVGELHREGSEFVFTYDAGVARALPGLPLAPEHRSADLFPIFTERVMSPSRADHALAMQQLSLDPGAGPFEVLAVSGGRRTGDSYELTPLPQAGPVELPFLVHGIRHLRSHEQAHVDMLRPGQLLRLRHDPDNEVNDRAVLVTDEEVRLGYVPDPLVEHVHKVMRHPHELRVERVNPPDAGFHLRLLVVLVGHLDEE
jgi:hypothetical protein